MLPGPSWRIGARYNMHVFFMNIEFNAPSFDCLFPLHASSQPGFQGIEEEQSLPAKKKGARAPTMRSNLCP
jgi:hypothetical protein